MVDVVVDQKPMDKLPYDPNDIPKAVRDRVAAVEALYSQTPEPTPDAQVPVSQVEAPPTPALPAPDAPPPPAELDDNSNTWKSRALSKEGRERKELEQANKDLGELQERYYNEVAQKQQPERRRAPPKPASPQFLTPEDEQNYGRDLLNVAQRAAMETVSPHLQNLEQQANDLRRQLAKEQRRSMDQAVEILVPDYREIDRNPRWHRWLLGIDVLSGRVRQTLLNEAISVGNAPRAASFFRSFLSEEVATGHVKSVSDSQPAPEPVPREPAISLTSLAAPGRARPATGGNASLPTDKPIYTRAHIAQLYSLHRKQAYVGREAEWSRIEADIFAAQREGRIRS